MISDPAELARRVAQRLSEDYGRALGPEVDAVLSRGVQDEVKLDIGEITGIAALIVATAQLIVMIIQGSTDSGSRTKLEITRSLKSRFRVQTGFDEKTIETVVTHTVDVTCSEENV